MRPFKTACLILAALAVLAVPNMASAQDATRTQIGGVNIEGYGEAGVRFFGEEPPGSRRAKFLEYRDINEGLYLQELRLRFFTPDEKYSGEFGGRQWGLQDQEFHLLGERLGKWQAGFDWDQMRHIYSTNARMLAVEGPRGVFTLPGRPPLNTYNSAPDLDEISVRWDTAHIFFKLTPTPDIDLIAEYTRIRKDGERPMSMAFGSPGNNFAEFLQPIEQTVHDFRLRGTWATERWQLQWGYTLSVFDNEIGRLRADNPCGSVAAVAGCGGDTGAASPVTGQSALPPNNMAHTFNLAGGINLPMRTRISANFTYTLALQNDNFFPHTINPNIVALNSPDLVLPRKSLEGNVRIAQFNLNGSSRPLPVPVTFNLKYRLFDLRDDSEEPIFPGQVVNDRSVTAHGRRAGRFEFTKHNGELDGRWQIIQPLALTVGGTWERWDRNEHREAPETDEFCAKANLDATPKDWLLIRATYLPCFRRILQYNTRAHAEHVVDEDATAAAAGQSTLLRKYDEAERDRQRADLLVQIMPLETLTFTPALGYRADDYLNSRLGLQHAITWSAGADLTWAPVKWLSFATGYMRELIWQKMESRSRPVTGSTVGDFVDFNWLSNTTDTVDTFHASATAGLIPKKLDLKFGGAYSYALGRVENRNPIGPASGTAAQNETARAKPMPAFEDSLLRIDVALRYHFAEVWTASLNYAYERFRKQDWRTDTLNPFQPGLSSIFLGNDLKNYDAHIVGITVGYAFK
jgi:MtrB/PioB family decaheme-associated outer membrane protein